MNKIIDRILFSEDMIQKRVNQLAAEITHCYQDKPLTVVALTNGACIFAADLIRRIPLDLQFDTLMVSSYKKGVTTGELNIQSDLKLPIENRHVLLVDDIIDTGHTLKGIVNYLQKGKPLSVKTCVLLDKQGSRKVEFSPDYYGFEVPNEIIVGYGLDYDERFRNLPYVAVFKPKVVAVAQTSMARE